MRLVGILVSLAILASCHKSLPHRQKWELYSIQGEYSHLDCPGQYVEWMDIDGQVFFLGCMLGNENKSQSHSVP